MIYLLFLIVFVVTTRIQVRELVKELMKPLPIIYQQSWHTREVPVDWTLASVSPIYIRRVRRRIQEATDLSARPRCWERSWSRSFLLPLWAHTGQPEIRPSRNGFRKGMSFSTNLISFYDRVTHLVDEGNTVDVVCLEFSKTFHIISYMILLEKLVVHVLDVCTVHFTKTGWMAGPREWWWLEFHPAGRWSPVVLPRAQCWGQPGFLSSSVIWMRGSSVPSASLQMTLNCTGVLDLQECMKALQRDLGWWVM